MKNHAEKLKNEATPQFVPVALWCHIIRVIFLPLYTINFH